MKNTWNLMLILGLALPAYGQEEATGEMAAEEAPAAEAAETEEAPAEPAAAEAADTTAEAEPETTETIPVDEPAPEEPLGPSDPLPIYAGLDWVMSTLSVSSLGGFETRNYDSGLYRLRFGARLLEKVNFEVHYGFDAGGEGAGEVSTTRYYGLFAVPTANLFDVIELAFPVGYAKNSVERPGASANLGSVGYGVNAELPFRTFGKDYPDLRLTAGWMVYYQKRDARLYGANLGLRYDFTTAGFGFGGIGNWFAGLDLWPFGDDEPAAEEPAAEEPAPEEPAADEPAS